MGWQDKAKRIEAPTTPAQQQAGGWQTRAKKLPTEAELIPEQGQDRYDMWLAQIDSKQTEVESGNQQWDSRGRLKISPKGAVGIKQIMPRTGPEAAELAGEVWDPQRLRNDADYNKRLGQAYQKDMFRRFDNMELGVAAYNMGPTALQDLIERHGDPRKGEISWSAFTSYMPKETQKYVKNIVGGMKQVQRDLDVPIPDEAIPQPGAQKPEAPRTWQEKTVAGLEEANRAIDTGVKGAFSFFADPVVKGPAQIGRMLVEGVAGPGAISEYDKQLQAIAQSNLGQAYEALTQPPEKPRTTLGKVGADAITASMMGVLPAAGLAAQAQRMGPLAGPAFEAARSTVRPGIASGLASVAGAEAAGAISNDNPIARLIGGLVGGSGPIAGKLTSTPRQRISEQTMEGITDYELEFARNAMREAKEKHNITLTLDQALPTETNARNIERALAGTEAGSDLAKVFREQLRQYEDLSKKFQQQVPGQVRERGQLGQELRQGTQNVTKALQQEVTDASRPFFQGATPVSQGFVAKKYRELMKAAQAVGPTTKSAKHLNSMAKKLILKRERVKGPDGREHIQTTYETRPEVLNRILNEAKDLAGASSLTGKSTSNTISKEVQSQASKFKKDLEAESPSFGEGMEVQRQMRREVVTPVMEGPLGEVVQSVGKKSGIPATPDSFNAILDRGTPINPKTGKPARSAIMTLRDELALRGGDEGIAAYNNGVATWMAGKFDEALSSDTGRVDPASAAKIYKALYGTKASKQGTQDAIAAVGKNIGLKDKALKEYVDGQEDILRLMGRLAQRPEPESRIGVQAAALDKDSRSKLIGMVGRWTSLQKFRQPLLGAEIALQRRNYEWLAQNLTSPEGVDLIRSVARARGTPDKQMVMLSNWLASSANAEEK